MLKLTWIGEPLDLERSLFTICRCIISKDRGIGGRKGTKEDFEIKIIFKWRSNKDEKFWIKDICDSPREDHDKILKY